MDGTHNRVTHIFNIIETYSNWAVLPSSTDKENGGRKLKTPLDTSLAVIMTVGGVPKTATSPK